MHVYFLCTKIIMSKHLTSKKHSREKERKKRIIVDEQQKVIVGKGKERRDKAGKRWLGGRGKEAGQGW